MGILCGTVWAHSAGPGPSLAVDDDHVGVGHAAASLDVEAQLEFESRS